MKETYQFEPAFEAMAVAYLLVEQGRLDGEGLLRLLKSAFAEQSTRELPEFKEAEQRLAAFDAEQGQ